MNVEIQDGRLIIGEETLRFSGYYFDIATSKEDPAGLAIMKNVLSQWAIAIEVLEDNDTAFLPYNLEDEWVESMKATRNGERIILCCVDVAVSGYSLGLDDLREFMLSPQTLVGSPYDPAVFGEYDREEIIAALRNARIVAA